MLDLNAKLFNPIFKGVSICPKIDRELRLLDVPAWIAGYMRSLFRGIVAEMTSGHYALSYMLEEFAAAPSLVLKGVTASSVILEKLALLIVTVEEGENSKIECR